MVGLLSGKVTGEIVGKTPLQPVNHSLIIAKKARCNQRAYKPFQ